MNILEQIKTRFSAALSLLTDDLAGSDEKVFPSQDANFGDYQANCAMPLSKRLNRPARELASEIVARLDVTELCEPPEIAGPGFINLRLKNSWLAAQLQAALVDPRLGIAPVARPRTIVVDFSSPNVAKPLHVGHIRSTVIGDSLARTLRFLGHNVITDNHLGDWGTQFGMIIYGYRNFLDQAAYQRSAIDELGRLYRLVRQLVDYHAGQKQLPELQKKLEQNQQALRAVEALPPEKDPKASKKSEKSLKQAQKAVASARDEFAELQAKLAKLDADPQFAQQAAEHADIGAAVLQETARLHAGDPENLRLWQQFMPPCMEDVNRIYRRLHVTFDHTHGESFYHAQIGPVVDELLEKNIARPSEGAAAIFLPDQPVPMLIRKQDGAFLYASSDLATIQYRMQHWRPDAILYVVDHRQSLHFEQLFAAARLWGYRDIELQHVSFGTVLGDDGRPFKTRSGDTVGLTSLLDEAVGRALLVVNQPDEQKPSAAELANADKQKIAETVGIAALKYADLSQNRTSDYVFSYDKMLAYNGNTATYLQYAYARVRSIFARGRVDIATLTQSGAAITIDQPAERALGLELLRFAEALADTVADYRPNLLTNYLYSLANCYATFFEQCPVLKAESAELRASRLLLCQLTALTLRQGLELLGIEVLEKM